MYTIYGIYTNTNGLPTKICIYSDINTTSLVNAISPTLKLGDNTAGSLEMTIPVGNPGYDKLEKMTSEIIVERYGTEIWAGRIISEKGDFHNNRVLTCEGELAYLIDSIQPQYEYCKELAEQKVWVEEILESIIEEHNKQVGTDKQFDLGVVTVEDETKYTEEKPFDPTSPVFVTNNETTLDAINSQLIDIYGGHIRVRRVIQNDKLHRYIDYLKDYNKNENPQTIRFGENLLDFTKNWDMTELATVVLPRGSSMQYTEFYTMDTPLTLRERKNEAGDKWNSEFEKENYVCEEKDIHGTVTNRYYAYKTESTPGEFEYADYVVNENAVRKYGWIAAVVDFEDIDECKPLFDKAVKYLREERFNEMIIEVSAIDLQYLSKDTYPINLLDTIRCVSKPHGLNATFPVTELSIQLDNPSNSTYTLNGSVKNNSLSGYSKVNDEILKNLDKNIPSEGSMLDKAKDQAAAIIDSATRGFVSILRQEGRSESLVISTNPIEEGYHPPDPDKGETIGYWTDTNVWQWNSKGLIYRCYDKDGNYPEIGPAITSDGKIVADYITTGVLRGGKYKNGDKDEYNFVLDMEHDDVYLNMKKGSIDLGISDTYSDGKFHADNNGFMRCEDGLIGGFTIGTHTISNKKMKLSEDGLAFYVDEGEKGLTFMGTYGTNYWSKKQEAKGLTIDMDKKNGYISWAYADPSDETLYTVKLMYTSVDLPYKNDPTKVFTANRVHLGCDLDLNNWTAYNTWIDPDTGGCVDGLSVDYGATDNVYLRVYNSNGTVAGTLLCRIRNGFILKGKKV